MSVINTHSYSYGDTERDSYADTHSNPDGDTFIRS